MPQAYISLGSNVGDRRHYLQLALNLLNKEPRNSIKKVSSIYRSHAVTLDGQPAPEFLNAACSLRTSLLPHDLLHFMQDIELRLGRIRHRPWAPRTIDLDILTYGDRRIYGDKLTIPHPGIVEREFVLRPLADIDHGWCHPESGRNVMDLLEALADSSKGGKVLECCGSLL
jgi:2-amino-4-hydroxy-6-hydroxymethyldihydropteridine diphosphokinase